MKRKKRFPTTMVATATIFSGLMVFVISAVFDQANQPCLRNYAFYGTSSHSDSSPASVIVDTSSNSQQTIGTSHSLSICNRDNQQISWLTWLFKRSDSVEFHYLDLLELLSRK